MAETVDTLGFKCPVCGLMAGEKDVWYCKGKKYITAGCPKHKIRVFISLDTIKEYFDDHTSDFEIRISKKL